MGSITLYVRWISIVVTIVFANLWAPMAHAQLPAPSLLEPDEGENVDPESSFAFDWSSVSSATTYRIRVGTSRTAVDDDSCGSTCVVDTTSTSSGYTVARDTFVAGRTYYWTVRAGNASSGGLWASVQSFVTSLPAFEAPNLLTPTDGASLSTSNSNAFDWSSVSGATSYRIRIGTSRTGVDDDTCSGCVVDTTNTSSNYTVPASTLTAGTTYYWTARAGNSSTGQGGYFASPWSFTASLPAFEAPNLLTPTDGASLSTSNSNAFDWSSVSGATSYRIRIGTSRTGVDDDTCSGCVVDTTNTSSNYTVPASTLTAGTTYYWTARAGNSSTGQGGYFASPWSFTASLPAFEAPNLLTPTDGASLSTSSSNAFDWSSVSGATSYRIRIGTSSTGVDDDTCSGCVVDTTNTSSDYTVPASTLTAGTTYYWTVRAGNSSTGQGGYFASPRSFTASLPAFEAPNLLTPTDGASLSPSSSNAFDWSSVSGATSYRIRIGTSSTGVDDDTCSACVVDTTNTSSDYTVPASTLTAGTAYYWTARAGNSSTGQGGYFASPWSFTASLPAFEAPNLLTPTDGASLSTSSSNAFDWSSVSGATSYRIRIGTSSAGVDDDTCSACVVDTTNTSSDYTVPASTLTAGTTYYWTVRAGNSSTGQGGYFASPWSFTASLPAFEAPNLLTPTDGASLSPSSSNTFAWSSVSGATSYRIRIGTSRAGVDDDTCSGCIVDTTNTSSDYTVPASTLTAGTTYYWTVRAGNSSTGQGGYFASPWSFTASLPAFEAPNLLTPTDGASLSTSSSNAFDWSSVSGATSYRIRIGTSSTGVDDDTCSACVVDTTNTSSDYTVPASTLTAGTTYYWTVRAGNSSTGQGGYFASPWSFTASLPAFEAPNLLTPTDGASLSTSSSNAFDWSSVSGATSYRIRIGTSSTGVDDDTCSACVVDTTNTSSDYTVPASTLTAGTTYYWTVRAGNSSTGQGGYFASPRSFTASLPAFEAPNLLTPTDGASLSTSSSNAFDWSSVSGATSYRIRIGTSSAGVDDDTCSACVVDTTNTSSDYTVPASTLTAGTAYYWTARAGNSSTGQGGYFASPWSFTASLPAFEAPNLLTPTDGASLSTSSSNAFDWSSVSGATSYRIRIGTSSAGVDDDTCSACVVDTTNTSSDYTVPASTLTAGTTYYWTVRAGNSSTGQGGYFASPRSFTASLPAFEAPNLLTPTDGASLSPSSSNTFAWSSVSGATSYRIRIGTSSTGVDDDTCSACVVDTTNTSSDYTVPASTLTAGTTYYWTVRAGNSSTGQGGYFASPRQFTVTEPSSECPDACLAGERRCAAGSNAYEVCLSDGVGCPEWTAPEWCSDEYSCVSGYCELGEVICDSDCVADSADCASASQPRLCAASVDGCYYWADGPACAGHEYCDFGVCRPLGVDDEPVDDAFLRDAFAIAGREFGIPHCLLMAIAETESNWDVGVTSGDGGQGIMQLTGGTLFAAANQLGLDATQLVGTDRTSVLNNIRGGAAMMRAWADGGDSGPLIFDGEPLEALETWWFVVTRFNGGGEDGLLTSSNYPFRVYNRFLTGSRTPRVEITFPPEVTTRPSTQSERLRGEANSTDDELFPAAPAFHIRIVEPFNVNDRAWHTCSGDGDRPSIEPGAAPFVENLQPNRTISHDDSFPVSGRVLSESDPLEVVTLAVGMPTGATDTSTYRLTPGAGTRVVSLNAFEFSPAALGGGEGTYVVGVWVKTTTRSPELLGQFSVTVIDDRGGVRLLFPLAGYTADSAPINSVFDHAQAEPYSQDRVVVAYTGERGDLSPGGFRGWSSASGQVFTLNGNYTAGEPDTDRVSSFLYYDGHPGYDFRASCGTHILAPAAGVARVRGGEYGIIEVEHTGGLTTVFLHAQRFLVSGGDPVSAGQPIAEVGSVGAAGCHLHMEVKLNGVVVDPYGWDGVDTDPYTRESNTRLWLNLEIGGESVCSPSCASGFSCIRGACRVVCESNSDCGVEEACEGGDCIPACEGHLGACDGAEEPGDDVGTNVDGGSGDDTGGSGDVDVSSDAGEVDVGSTTDVVASDTAGGDLADAGVVTINDTDGATRAGCNVARGTGLADWFVLLLAFATFGRARSRRALRA